MMTPQSLVKHDFLNFFYTLLHLQVSQLRDSHASAYVYALCLICNTFGLCPSGGQPWVRTDDTIKYVTKVRLLKTCHPQLMNQRMRCMGNSRRVDLDWIQLASTK